MVKKKKKKKKQNMDRLWSVAKEVKMKRAQLV